MEVIIDKDVIHFNSYEFKPSSIYPKYDLKVNEIRIRVMNYNPSAFILKNNDIIFIPKNKVSDNEIECFCKKNNIESINKTDVWSFILEPFLDTEYTDEIDTKLNERLIENHIDLNTVKSIRNEITQLMIEYNIDSGLWDWTYLGLYDVFSACSGILTQSKMTNEYFQKAYWDYINIALKGSETAHCT